MSRSAWIHSLPAYYWVPFCIPKITLLPGDWILPNIWPDISESRGNVSGRTFWSKQFRKHVFWIRTEGDTAVLSSAHIVSTWHFQLYTWMSSYLMAGFP